MSSPQFGHSWNASIESESWLRRMFRREGEVFLLGTAICGTCSIWLERRFTRRPKRKLADGDMAAARIGRPVAKRASYSDSAGSCKQAARCKQAAVASRRPLQAGRGRATGTKPMLPISLTIAGAAAILNIWLGAYVLAKCASAGKVISVGDGGDPRLLARMRAQANFVEYAPFVLILIALIEFAHGPRPLAVAGGHRLHPRPHRARLRHGPPVTQPAAHGRHHGDMGECC